MAREQKPGKGPRKGRPDRGQRAGAQQRQDGRDRAGRNGSARRGTGRPEHRKGAAGYIEGRHAVHEALIAGVPLKDLMVADHLLADERSIDGLLAAAREAGVPARTVPRSLLDELSAHGAHQGVMATARPYSYASLSDLIERAGDDPNALIVVCDHVTDPGNLGAIVRSAEVVGAVGVLVPNRRAAEVTATAYKASAGAVAHLPVAREANLATCLERLKEAGFWVAGASEHAQTTVWEAPLAGRIALVMGSEGEGISRLLLDRCDFLVKLPQRGVIESLNVAQSATAIMYEWLRRTTAGE